MTNSREILSRINSIKDTQKITNAMYMISSSKVKKARADLDKTVPFFESLQASLIKMLDSIENEDVKSKYFNKRDYLSNDERTEGYLVITADKGLASSYNHNVIKEAEKRIESDDTNLLFVVGEVGRKYFQKKNKKINELFKYTAQNPNVNRARAIAETLLEYFVEKKVDDVYVIYTIMGEHNTEQVRVDRILPLEIPKHDNSQTFDHNVEFYPDVKNVVDRIVPVYLSGFVYGALVEAFCAENTARMMAMSSATDAANEMIKSLNIDYNRARQAAITQEITEIVSGANALKNKEASN